MSASRPSLDRLLYTPTSHSAGEINEHHYVFFITGNPGVIGYYEEFLSTLFSLLNTSRRGQYTILGESLVGFELDSLDSKCPEIAGDGPPYGLQRQIELAEERLTRFVRGELDHRDKGHGLQSRNHALSRRKVILIGHSVGSYILLEVLRRRKNAASSTSALNIVGGILLFPTVTHIAKSPSGLKLSVCSKPQYRSDVV